MPAVRAGGGGGREGGVDWPANGATEGGEGAGVAGAAWAVE